MTPEKNVTIPTDRYEELLERELKLIALESAGVDNWQGYDDAMTILQEMKENQQ
jgi:hypothetical protein